MRSPLFACLLATSLGVALSSPVHAVTWAISPVDPAHNAGWSPSLRLDAAGLPRVSYWTPFSGIHYAVHDGVAWQNELVPPTGAPAAAGRPARPEQSDARVGPDGVTLIRTVTTALALDAAGEPWIAHALLDQDDGNRGLLMLSHREGGAWVTQQTQEYTYGTPSIEVDAAGNVHVLYGSSDGLRYGVWDSAEGWTSEVVDATGYGSLRLDAQGNPHVAYVGGSPWALRYAEKSGGQWQSQPVDALGYPRWPSLVLDFQGRAHIAYTWSWSSDPASPCDLRYAEQKAEGWDAVQVDAGGQTGVQPSLALDAGNNPVIAYYTGNTLDLKSASRDSWWNWTVQTVDAEGNTGHSPSLAVDPAGQPLVVYTADFSLGLRMAKGTATIGVPLAAPALAFRLRSCGPNPLVAGRPLALALELPADATVWIEAYDAAGRQLAASPPRRCAAGVAALTWDPGWRSPGLYLVRVRASSGLAATARVAVVR
jgi:hypothetical protein